MKLSQRLSKLIEKLAKLPPNKKALDVGGLGPELQGLVILAQKLETFSGDSDLAEKYEELKSLLQSKQEEFDAYKVDSESQRKILRLELDAFHKEQAKPKEKDDELPTAQLMILYMLPSQNQGTWGVRQIADRTSVSIPDVEVHLQILGGKHYVATDYGQWGGEVFYRTTGGSKYLMVLRQAFDDTVVKQRKFPNCGATSERILLMLKGEPNGVAVASIYSELAKPNSALPNDTPKAIAKLESDGFIGPIFFNPEVQGRILLGNGFTYLFERGKL